jgi:hypothetical protein
MGVLKSLRRRKWKAAVNREFRRWHGVDLRTIGETIGARTLRHLLNDEYELAPQSPAVGARNVAQMLAHVYRVDIEALAMRDFALTMAPLYEAATDADQDDWNEWEDREVAGAPARAVAATLPRS